jgi:hypothetical protein
MNGLSSTTNLYDPFFPKAWGSYTNLVTEKTDVCLGAPDSSSIYHYHIMPPCKFTPSLAAANACSNVKSCSDGILAYALNGYSTKKTITPIGIAKDGRIIYGPYDETGSIPGGSNVDVCNGKNVGGYYSYFATQFHPYFVGCWGPGNYPAIG